QGLSWHHDAEQNAGGVHPINPQADARKRALARAGDRDTLVARMKEPTSIADVDGATVREGDVVRVLGIPDLQGMKSPYREETEAVFRHIKGSRKRVYGFDHFGCAILVFRIARGKHAGRHSVAIEPQLIRKLNRVSEGKRGN